MPLEIEARQRDLFDSLSDRYEAHYDDATSQSYRDRFVHPHLFRGVDLSGARVLDCMCGSGETTRYLLSRGARVEGLDISGNCIERYRRRWPGCAGHARSILGSGLADASFDVVAIVGGLHHLPPHVEEAVAEICRVLRPGGRLCFLEPHCGSLMDVARRIWYRMDPLFEENESAIDLEGLQATFGDRFSFGRLRYVGGPAYLGVLNSMIFRVPTWLKPIYAPPAMLVDWLISPLMTRRFSCVAIGQWQKK